MQIVMQMESTKKPTLRFYLDTRTAKCDGKYPVKLQATFNRISRLYGTNIDLSKLDWDKINGKNVRGDLLEIKDSLADILSAANAVVKTIVPFSFDEFKKKFFGGNNDSKNKVNSIPNFFELADEIIKTKNLGTAKDYTNVINQFKKFRPKLTFNNFPPDIMSQFHEWLLKNGKSISTASSYEGTIRVVINEAIKRKYLKAESILLGKQRGGHIIPKTERNVTVPPKEELKKFINYRPISGTNEELGYDFFMWSYLGSGMNLKDILLIEKKDIVDGVLYYTRAKTKNTTQITNDKITVPLLDNHFDIIKKYAQDGSKSARFLFPFITEDMDDARIDTKIQTIGVKIRKGIRKICKDLELTYPFKFETAKDCFVTGLIRRNKSPMEIQQMIGHKTPDMINHYVAKFDVESKRKAQQSLLDL